MSRIVFVGAHDLMVPYINYLAKTNEVLVYESGVFRVELESEVELVPLQKTLGGLGVLDKSERSLPWFMKGLNGQLENDNPDIIIVLDFIRLWYWQVLWYRKRYPNVKIILYSETQRLPNSFFSRVGFKVFWSVFLMTRGLVNQIFTFTDLGKNFFELNSNYSQVSTMPPIVDVELFKDKGTKEYLPDGTLRVLMNARYAAYKRHKDVFAAVASLIQKGYKISLTCIGREGEGLEEVKEQARNFEVSNLVTFLPTVDRLEMPSIYAKHDVLVLPSDNEAIGMAVPEAMACGLATITSDTVGANVYVKEGVTGLIFKTGEVSGLTDALRCFYNRDLGLRMGISAREHIEDFAGVNLFTRFKNVFLS